MPERSAVIAVFAEIFARCGISRDAEELEPFVLCPDGDHTVNVHYDEDDQVIWLSTFLEPITSAAAPGILRRLLLDNLRSVEEGFACALDADSSTPVLQSQITGSCVRMSDFEAALERHLQAMQLLRSSIDAPHTASANALANPAALWG